MPQSVDAAAAGPERPLRWVVDCSGSRLRLLYRRLSTVDCCCRFSGSRLNDFGSVRLCVRRSWSRAEVTVVVRRFLVRVHSRVRWLCCGRCNPSRLLGWVPFLVRVNEWRFAAYSHRSAFFHLPPPGSDETAATDDRSGADTNIQSIRSGCLERKRRLARGDIFSSDRQSISRRGSVCLCANNDCNRACTFGSVLTRGI